MLFKTLNYITLNNVFLNSKILKSALKVYTSYMKAVKELQFVASYKFHIGVFS